MGNSIDWGEVERLANEAEDRLRVFLLLIIYMK